MTRYFMAGLVSALSAFAATGQTVVTEADFLSALTAEHPAVAAASEELALARAALIEAQTFENPSLGIAREDPEGPVAQTDLTLSWQLPDLNRGLRIEARRKGLEASEARLSHALLTLRLEMREVYAAWALQSARHDRLTRQLERMEQLTSRESMRAERGESSGLEARRLAVAASSLRAQTALAAAAEQEQSIRARSWNPELPPDAEPELPELPPPPAIPDASPLLVAAEAELEAAEAARRAARRSIRSPELMAGWQDQHADGQSFTGPLFGLSWAVPLFERGRAERVAAEARMNAARARLERTRRELDLRRGAASTTYEQLAREVATLDAAGAETETMLRGAEAAFISGETSLTDLLDTWRSATEAEMAALELREVAMEAQRGLERLAISAQPTEKEIQP